ncbi:reverse transcriptase domain-containing protein [Tanacetum coccineum]
MLKKCQHKVGEFIDVECPLHFDDRVGPANLLPIHMLDFDVILGMDWLASHRATIDCYARTVILERLDVELCVQGVLVYPSQLLASMRIESNLIYRSSSSKGRTVEVNRPIVPNEQAQREKVMTEAHRSKLNIRRASGSYTVGDSYVKWYEFPYSLLVLSKLADIFRQEIVRFMVLSDFYCVQQISKFTSHFKKGLQKAWGTTSLSSYSISSSTDGQSERSIQHFGRYGLRACALEWTGIWDEYFNAWYAAIQRVKRFGIKASSSSIHRPLRFWND